MVYIILDEVGTGVVKYLSNDGLIVKHTTHPQALEMPGTAYTDALPATLRGRMAITVCAASPDHGQTGSHWHQMSDRMIFVDDQSLCDSHQFAWDILQQVDREVRR